MEKIPVRVPYNEKRLQFLDATLPYLVLKDGEVLYNFDYFVTQMSTFIRALNEFDAPTVPYRLWNFKGVDMTTYYNTIEFIEYDRNVILEAAKEVYPGGTEEEWETEVQAHYTRLMEMDEGICEARQDIEETNKAVVAEKERKQNLLQDIANRTANDEDALPSPEVMQLRIDESNRMIEEAFDAIPSTTSSEIIVETPKLITSVYENTPTKLVL